MWFKGINHINWVLSVFPGVEVDCDILVGNIHDYKSGFFVAGEVFNQFQFNWWCCFDAT
ncbi:MAG: hypothetical protein ACTSRP_24360 [Candidatus Helarchaeota archaeon]